MPNVRTYVAMYTDSLTYIQMQAGIYPASAGTTEPMGSGAD